ncbi:HupE/UreJ family protein [Ilyomonas limi]|uniref:HupE/UreJ family protein n=1 Tax=Ilyomonas limi TaxID=2575867 RepID=A0A4U3KWR3_9BACT|nr:HupE/UreJ family protein [Ilyomonas limi]TKK66104.1 HupE/UreJ family protein [Ilyomonas limi]
MRLENTLYKQLPALLCFILLALPVLAHPINITMERAPTGDVIWFYFKMGVTHIVPYGLDHILFVISLCLLSTKISTILWQASAFTVAHSITLALSMQSVIVAPSQLIEPVISLSIVFVAVENIILSELKPWRVLIVFFFGLVHGMGFASALNEVGLPRNNFFSSIIAFNLGVEIGQIAVILMVFGLIVIPFGKRLTYKRKLVYPMSAIIALIAAYWTVERIIIL